MLLYSGVLLDFKSRVPCSHFFKFISARFVEWRKSLLYEKAKEMTLRCVFCILTYDVEDTNFYTLYIVCLLNCISLLSILNRCLNVELSPGRTKSNFMRSSKVPEICRKLHDLFCNASSTILQERVCWNRAICRTRINLRVLVFYDLIIATYELSGMKICATVDVKIKMRVRWSTDEQSGVQKNFNLRHKLFSSNVKKSPNFAKSKSKYVSMSFDHFRALNPML